MKRTVIKTVSLLLLLAFFTDTACYGLATLPASQNPIVKREILATLQRTQIRFAESEDAIRLLNANNASCLLLSSGKYLVTKEVAQNDLKLLRATIHEDIEAIMQIIAKEDRSRYQGIKELILKHFPPHKDNDLPIDLYVNHTVAMAFEWLTLIHNGIALKGEVPAEEAAFIDRIERIIKTSKHSYFKSEFWDPGERSAKIRSALNSGMRFYQTASDDRKDQELKEGARSHAPPDARADDEPILVGLEDELFVKTKPEYLEEMPDEIVSLVRSVSSIDQLEGILKKIALEVQNGVRVRKEFLPHLEKIALLFGFEHNPCDILTSWASVFKNLQVPQADRDVIDGLFHTDANFTSPYAFNDVIPAIDGLLDNIGPQPERYTIDSRVKQYLSLIKKLRSVLSEIEGPEVYKHPMTVREILERALRHKETIAADADHYLDDLVGFKLFINNVGMDAAQRKEAMSYYSGLIEKHLSLLDGVSIRTLRREVHASGHETVNIYLHGLLNHKDFGSLPVKIQLRLISGIFKEAAMYYTYKIYKRWDNMPPWVETINFEEITSFRQLQELLLANFKSCFESRGPLKSVKAGDILIMPPGKEPGFDIARVSERASGEIDHKKFLITGPYPAGGQGGFRFASLDKKIKEKGFFGITAPERYMYINLLLHNFKLLDYSEAVSDGSKDKLRNLSEANKRSFAHISKCMLFDVLGARGKDAAKPALKDLEYLPDSPKILLISPYEKRDLKVGSFLAPAMGVYRLAGYLRLFGVRVDVFDPNLDDAKNLDDLVRKEDYDFIGSSVYEPTLENDINLAAHLKDISPRSVFIAGGEGAYYNRGRLFGKDSPFVIIARGFGEFSLLDMAAMRMRKGADFMKDPGEMRGIEGLLIRTGDGILETPLPGKMECDDYRAISLFSDTSAVPYERYWGYMEGLYSAEQLRKRKDVSLDSIRTVRGVTESHCPMGCSFCTSTHFLDDSTSGKKQPVLFLTADEIMLTLRNVMKYHPGVRTIFFNDDNFMFNRKRVMDLCDQIEKEFGSGRLNFIALGRVDCVDFEMLKRMKEAGFIQLNYGIESLSDRVLLDMKKKIKAKKNIEGLEVTLLAGIKPLIALIPFYPTSTMDDVRETMEVAVEFVNIGAGLTYWPFVEAFKGAAITKDAESGAYDLTPDGKFILPKDERVRECALKAVQGTAAVIDDIKKEYKIEGRLPHAVDVMAFFIAFYRTADMDATYIELAVRSAMSKFINGAAGAYGKDEAGEADIVSQDKRISVAGSTASDYYRYRKKNVPAVSEYGVTMVAGLPMPDGVLKIKEVVGQAVSDCVGIDNVYLYGNSHTQATISPVLRSNDRPITSIINARGDSLDTEKMLDVVRDSGRFGVQFSKVRIDGRGGISLLGAAIDKDAKTLLGLRKGLIVDAKFDGRIQDLNAELHTTIGYIRNFDKLSRKRKEAVVSSIERALEGYPNLGALSVEKIGLVYYQHRNLSKVINKIDLELGVDNLGLRNRAERALLSERLFTDPSETELIDIIEVDDATGKETVVAVATRNEAHAKGLLHRISNVIMISPDGKLLLQKRVPWKKTSPGLWSITGGHVTSRQTYREAAISEVKQELGIICDTARLFPVGPEGSYAYSRRDAVVNNRERKALYYYVLSEEENRQLLERKDALVKMSREELEAMGNEGEVADLDWKEIEVIHNEILQDAPNRVYAPTLFLDLFPNDYAIGIIKGLVAGIRQYAISAGQRSRDAEQALLANSSFPEDILGLDPNDYSPGLKEQLERLARSSPTSFRAAHISQPQVVAGDLPENTIINYPDILSLEQDLRAVLKEIGKEDAIEDYARCLGMIYRNVPASYFKRFVENKDHGLTHIINVMIFAAKILKNDSALKESIDAKALVTAIVFHDIAALMVREKHSVTSRYMAEGILSSEGMEPSFVEMVVRIANAHHRREVKEIGDGEIYEEYEEAKVMADADALSNALDLKRIYLMGQDKSKDKFFNTTLTINDRMNDLLRTPAIAKDRKDRIAYLSECAFRRRVPSYYFTDGAKKIIAVRFAEASAEIKELINDKESGLKTRGFTVEEISDIEGVVDSVFSAYCASPASGAKSFPATSDLPAYSREVQQLVQNGYILFDDAFSQQHRKFAMELITQYAARYHVPSLGQLFIQFQISDNIDQSCHFTRENLFGSYIMVSTQDKKDDEYVRDALTAEINHAIHEYARNLAGLLSYENMLYAEEGTMQYPDFWRYRPRKSFTYSALICIEEATEFLDSMSQYEAADYDSAIKRHTGEVYNNNGHMWGFGIQKEIRIMYLRWANAGDVKTSLTKKDDAKTERQMIEAMMLSVPLSRIYQLSSLASFEEIDRDYYEKVYDMVDAILKRRPMEDVDGIISDIENSSLLLEIHEALGISGITLDGTEYPGVRSWKAFLRKDISKPDKWRTNVRALLARNIGSMLACKVFIKQLRQFDTPQEMHTALISLIDAAAHRIEKTIDTSRIEGRDFQRISLESLKRMRNEVSYEAGQLQEAGSPRSVFNAKTTVSLTQDIAVILKDLGYDEKFCTEMATKVQNLYIRCDINIDDLRLKMQPFSQSDPELYLKNIDALISPFVVGKDILGTSDEHKFFDIGTVFFKKFDVAKGLETFWGLHNAKDIIHPGMVDGCLLHSLLGYILLRLIGIDAKYIRPQRHAATAVIKGDFAYIADLTFMAASHPFRISEYYIREGDLWYLRPEKREQFFREILAGIREGYEDAYDYIYIGNSNSSGLTDSFLINLGALYLDAGMFDFSAKQYEAALSIDPLDPMTIDNLGLLYAKQGREVDAIRMWKALSRSYPSYYKKSTSFNLAIAYYKLRQYDKAVEYQKLGLTIAPSNADDYYQLGKYLFFMISKRLDKDYSEAIDAFAKAYRLDPKYGPMVKQMFSEVAPIVEQRVEELRKESNPPDNGISAAKSFPAGEGDMLKNDKLLQDESRQSASGAPSYDSEFATVLLTDLLHAQLQEERTYEIKYDASKLSASQIAIIEEYIRLLQARSSTPDNIRLKPFSSVQGSKESLIAVYSTGKDFKGEGHVDVTIPEGEIKEYLLRITGMINIALASSNIPDNISSSDIDRYAPIISFIKSQYKSILNQEISLPEAFSDIPKAIRTIVLNLPRSMRMDTRQIEEYNISAKSALSAA